MAIEDNDTPAISNGTTALIWVEETYSNGPAIPLE
jgi:hypothetical protein